MADTMTKEQRRKCMQHISSKDTKPEKLVRHYLFSKGYRFRKNVRNLPGTPDLVFRKYNTAIFINGCFWHGHKGCRYYISPKTNPQFWDEKVAGNRERDERNISRLESLGWSVITVWECELKGDAFEETMNKVIFDLNRNKARWEQYRQYRKADKEFARAEAMRKKLIRDEIE